MEANTDLSNLFNLLFGQKYCLTDDLLLEKLLNEIENTPESLQQINLTSVIDSLSEANVDQRIKSFGLRLIGLKTSIMEENELDAIQKLLQTTSKTLKKPTCPPIIKSSVLKMLRNFVSNNQTKTIITKTDVMSLATDLLTDSSIFVCHEAELFISDFLMKYLPNSDPAAIGLINHLLSTFDKKNKTYFTHSMAIFKRICEILYDPSIENELLKLLLIEEEEFICQKVCDVIAVIQGSRKDYSKIDDILKKLTALDFIDTSLKYCCDLLTSNLPPDLITKLQSYLQLVMDTTRKMDKTGNSFRSILATLLKLDFEVITDDFRHYYTEWLCDLIQKEQTEIPKAILNILNKLQVTYHHSGPHAQLLVKTTITDIINSRMVCDTVLVKTLSIYAKIDTDIGEIEKSISYLLYHPNWAVQDSVLELIGKCVSENKRNSHECILQSHLHVSVWDKLTVEANEGFIKATALATLAEIALEPNLWSNLIGIIDESKIINQILVFLLTDSEAVVRRAATRPVINLSKSKSEFKWKFQFLSAMQCAVSDSDWEVKLGALEFWKEILEEVESVENRDLNLFVEKLDNFGFCFALVNAVDDCDCIVRIAAVAILKTIQEKLRNFNVNCCEDENFSSPKLSKDDETVNLIEPMDDGVMEDVLNICDSDVVNHKVMDSILCKSERSFRKDVIVFGNQRFVNTLLDLQLEKIENLAEINSDIYDGNLTLLVTDMIVMHKKIGCNDVILDCY